MNPTVLTDILASIAEVRVPREGCRSSGAPSLEANWDSGCARPWAW